MGTYQAQESEVINAPPEKIYAIISDYHEGHPAILPSRYFTEIVVTAGGQGEGNFLHSSDAHIQEVKKRVCCL